MMVGYDGKAPVHIRYGTTYYRMIDWCAKHIAPERTSQTFWCRSYGCRLSLIFCKEQCQHREGI